MPKRSLFYSLFLGVFLPLVFAYAEQPQIFQYTDPATKQVTSITLTSEEVSQLQPLLNLALEPGPELAKEMLGKIPTLLRDKLAFLARSDLSLVENNDAITFSKHYGISPEVAGEIRDWYLDASARSIAEKLAQNPKMQVRLIARDTNDIYVRLQALLSTDNTQLGWTPEQKLSVRERARWVNLSRPMSGMVTSANDIQAAFRISDTDLKTATEIAIVDSGYEGTIPWKLKPLLKGSPLDSKVSWNFIWRSPSAPPFIKEWADGKVISEMKARYPQHRSLTENAHFPSFRVNVIEHQPKWNQRGDAFNSKPTYIMLDLDDTVLKEVPVNPYAEHASVQSLRYKPSAKQLEKYKSRLEAPPDPGKVIHYKLENDGTMIGYVTVRPSITELFESLDPLIRSGQIKFLITSANDPERTTAVVEQLKISGKSLKDWGATVVPPEAFLKDGGIKDMGLLRRSLNISPESRVTAIDDLPQKLVASQPHDRIIPISPWNFSVLYNVLNHDEKAVPFLLHDLGEIREISDELYQQTQVSKASSVRDRLRILGQLTRIYSPSPSGSYHGKDPLKGCGDTFRKVIGQ